MTQQTAYPPGDSPFRREAERPLVERAFPVSSDVRTYRGSSLRRDLIAGLTVAALAMPSSMAFAEVAGLSPVTGLYTLLLPTVAYAALGSSKRLMIGPEGTTAALVGAAIAPVIASDPERAIPAASMLALLVGVIYLAARLVRLGWIADYFSRPVLVGYIHGVALVLIAGQLGKLTGVSIGADTPPGQVAELFAKLDEVDGLTVAVGLGSLAVLFAFKRWLPMVPAALTVVVAGIAVSAAFALGSHGVATVGPIPSGLPSLAWPGLSGGEVAGLMPAALGIFVVSFADSILTARSYAGRHGEHVRANQELVALGAASVAAGFSQGFSISASGSRTAVAEDMGVRTQLAALYAAGTVAVVLVVLTAPMEQLPSACLGAVIVFAASGLIDLGAWKDLARHSRRETAIAAVTTLGVVTIGVIPALLVALALSIVDVVSRSARPHDAVLGYVPRLDRWADVELHPSARITPGIVVYRLDARLFFANATYVKARVQEAIAGSPTPVQLLVFDAESVTSVDATGLEALRDVITSVQADGVTFVLAVAHQAVLDMLQRGGCLELIGDAHVAPTVSAAVQAPV